MLFNTAKQQQAIPRHITYTFFHETPSPSLLGTPTSRGPAQAHPALPCPHIRDGLSQLYRSPAGRLDKGPLGAVHIIRRGPPNYRPLLLRHGHEASTVVSPSYHLCRIVAIVVTLVFACLCLSTTTIPYRQILSKSIHRRDIEEQ